MPETIVLTVNAVVAGGPKLSANRTIEVDAYDKISVSIPDATTGMDVELQPGGSGQVTFLLVTSDRYGDDLTYKVNAGATDRVLDQPHILTGKGAVGMLAGAPETLSFDNAMGADVEIQVLIGRDATPP
jgi:hypothetical protein